MGDETQTPNADILTKHPPNTLLHLKQIILYNSYLNGFISSTNAAIGGGFSTASVSAAIQRDMDAPA